MCQRRQAANCVKNVSVTPKCAHSKLTSTAVVDISTATTVIAGPGSDASITTVGPYNDFAVSCCSPY